MSAGISFVGAGPGATDLITVRGARRIGEADVVLWTPAIVEAGWVRENTRPGAELIDMARHGDDEIVEVYRRAVRDKLRVARLHAGDPATWPGLRAQLDICARVGLPAEVIAGVSPASAAAVSMGVSLLEPGFADSVISAGQETAGMPDLAQIKEYAQFGTTMAVLVPAARAAELADALRSGGFDDETPIVAAYKVSWPDEIVVRTTIGELVATVKQHRLWRHTLFLIGGAVRAGRARAVAGEPARRPESVVRWSRTRSKSSWRAESKRTVVETPAPEPERVTVTAVAEPEQKPAPAKAAAASTATKSVTAQTTPAKKTPAKPAPVKAAAKQPVKAATPAKTAAKTPTKKTTRTQPQRGRRTGS
ncbi:precorrin-4/cobalt-precorrin-4 C11-methyltransferase [Kibdelosporangium banguiense]|uniref:Precorrin-4/cobalt-precorrin-4 C11-methyltransferase n=1 Tax=Kibdelosporangium banguiense TaxID=1365924 RepID=A0ABS4THF6_9PSEU|nr:cobalt-precorrin-4/precorrin-4 C(11)-methyltransferase [Kibdelosporangium banguiense]MBP2323867.1 precorrin-4/cobalt-precorrin-4 C11-methyltransferase [Kibdelosporangium banguiense]